MRMARNGDPSSKNAMLTERGPDRRLLCRNHTIHIILYSAVFVKGFFRFFQLFSFGDISLFLQLKFPCRILVSGHLGFVVHEHGLDLRTAAVLGMFDGKSNEFINILPVSYTHLTLPTMAVV